MIEVKHRGSANEMRACLWLLDQGYEVFRNVSQHGDVDIVALKGVETLRIDVKAANFKVLADKSIKVYRCGKPVPAGVRILLALPNGEMIWDEDLK